MTNYTSPLFDTNFNGQITTFAKREFNEDEWKNIWLNSDQKDVFEKCYKMVWFFDPDQKVPGMKELLVLAVPDSYKLEKKDVK